MALGENDSRVLQLADAAFGKKSSLMTFWQAVAENHYPERADFTRTMNYNEDMTSMLYSSEPILFRREFGNFIGAALRPKGRDWFGCQLEDARLRSKKIPRVEQTLLQTRDTIRGLMYNRKSGYTRAMTTADHDYVTFGNAVGSVEPRPTLDGLRYRTWHLRDCAWLENFDGEVDTMFRKFKVTAQNLVAEGRKRGWEVSQKVTDVITKTPNKEFECMHVQMPLVNYDATRKSRMDWVSIYLDVTNKERLALKEVPEFNYFVDRWFLLDGSQYAISPCVVCSLPDSRTLQVMTWSVMEAGEKAVEPPLVARGGTAIIGGIDIRAAGVTWVDKNFDERNGEVIRALEMGGQPQFGELLREGIRQNLNAAWFLNKLNMPQTYDKTAYEAQRLHEEFLRAAQPIMEPAEAERNGNHLELTMNIALRLGLLGGPKDLPKELRGRDVGFIYDNPLEDARKQAATFAYKGAAEINAIAAQTNPEVLKNFDANTAYRDAIGGVAPPNWLKDPDEANEEVEEAKDEQTDNKAIADVAALSQLEAGAMPGGKPPAAPKGAPLRAAA